MEQLSFFDTRSEREKVLDMAVDKWLWLSPEFTEMTREQLIKRLERRAYSGGSFTDTACVGYWAHHATVGLYDGENYDFSYELIADKILERRER